RLRRGPAGAAADCSRLAPHLELHPAARAARTAAPPALPGPHPTRRPSPRLATPLHPHRYGASRLQRPAGRRRAAPAGPSADQPAPQTRPAPHPAARAPVAVGPAAGHHPVPSMEDPTPRPDPAAVSHGD